MKRNSYVVALGSVLLVAGCAVQSALAASLEQISARGVLQVAVYADFPPYSESVGGRAQGVDVAIGRALAEKIGVSASFRVFQADESMADDLRNQVWKGHYLGGGTADLMMHAPFDPEYAQRNEQVRIVAPYSREEIVVARTPRISNARTFDAFLDEKIGVEMLTMPSYFLLSGLGGGLRDNAVHFRSVTAAVEALKAQQVAAVFAPRGEIEGGLGKDVGRYLVGRLPTPGLQRTAWDLGVAVKGDNKALAEAVDRAMSELRAAGAIGRIFDAHGLTYVVPSQLQMPVAMRSATVGFR